VSDDPIIAKLLALLADVTGAPLAQLRPTSTAADTPGWDSVANLSFIAAVEEEFGVEILTQEAMQLRGIMDVAALLARKGVTGAP